jgi:hypothetical protein
LRRSESLCLLRNPGCIPPHRLVAFAAFQFFYLLTLIGRVRTPDEYNTLYTTESLVLRGSTSVPQAVQLHNFYGRYDLHGEPRAAYPLGRRCFARRFTLLVNVCWPDCRAFPPA